MSIQIAVKKIHIYKRHKLKKIHNNILNFINVNASIKIVSAINLRKYFFVLNKYLKKL